MIGQTVSHYKVTEKLGSGGMSVVYLAEDLALGRTVALKFLSAERSAITLAKERFIAEARAASSLDHPNIGTIFEVGRTSDEQVFIAMAYYAGGTLAQKIAEGPLDVSEATEIARQIARGLRRAHEQGIVHRDIKPANIVFTEDGMAKILDFGLAKLAGGARLTKGETTLGTVAYMSPEQVRAAEADHRTDIWSLGVIMYEMLVKRVPFEGDYEASVLYLIVNAEPKPLEDLRLDVPAEACRVVAKCLQKDPGSRYQSVGELLDDLERLSDSGRLDVSKRSKLAASALPSIAVLHFEDMSPARDQEYFCEGISEELTNALTHLEGLHVAARTSAFQYKDRSVDVRQVGKELGVGSVLEGSVRKSGNRLRVTAQLVNVENGYHLWSEKFDRDLDDIFAIQDEISLTIVDKLRVKLLRDERSRLVRRYTEDQEAYNLYLKGRHFWNRRYEVGVQKAMVLFEQAIATDPRYALAYAGIADCHNIRGHYAMSEPKEAASQAKAAIARALEIDDRLAEAYTSLGWLRTFHDWDWKGARVAFEKALELNPNSADTHSWYGLYFGVIGRFDDSLRELKHALELDPIQPILNTVVALGLYWVRQLDEAEEQFRKTLEMDPNFSLARLWLGFARCAQSRWRDAIEDFEMFAGVTGENPMGIGYLGYAYAASGQAQRAREFLDRLDVLSKERFVSSLYRAIIHMGLGDKDEAFHCLDKALVEREPWMPSLKYFPMMDSLRSDPRFPVLMRKIGFEG